MHLCFQHFQYTLSTKRNTIQRFEKHTAMKERQLMKAEKKLEDDAIAFEGVMFLCFFMILVALFKYLCI